MTITETRLSKAVSVASWLIVFSLFVSVTFLWMVPPTGLGPVANVVGILGAQVFYSVVYGVEALLLMFAKLTGRMKLRKVALLAIFFTGAFTLGLTISIVGFSIGMLDNMALFGLAGLCYLYWKIKTEYVSHEELLSMQAQDSHKVQ